MKFQISPLQYPLPIAFTARDSQVADDLRSLKRHVKRENNLQQLSTSWKAGPTTPTWTPLQMLTGTPVPNAEAWNFLSQKGHFGLRGCVQISAEVLIEDLDFDLVHFSIYSWNEQTEKNPAIVTPLRKGMVTGENECGKRMTIEWQSAQCEQRKVSIHDPNNEKHLILALALGKNEAQGVPKWLWLSWWAYGEEHARDPRGQAIA